MAWHWAARPLCETAFWIAAILLAYTFAGYGVVIGILGRIAKKPLHTPPGEPSPPVVAVVVAHDEEERIGRRVLNLLKSELPVRVIVCSDGSSDGTAAAARAAGAVTVLEFPLRRGKAACLNDAFLAAGDTEIVLLADARQEFMPETIPRLVRHFRDPAVGAVSGLLRIAAPKSSAGEGVDAYWRLETTIRQAESDFDSCIGCTGAVCAVRRKLFQPIPEDTILDDVVIPMTIAIGGSRVIYDSEAQAFDPQPLEPAAENRRKTRTLAGNFQMLFRHPDWLLPWRNRLAWQLISHKYLRLAGPLLLAAILLSSGCLSGQSAFYRACFFLQLALYALAVAGLLLPGLNLRIFSIPAAFAFLNWMTVKGFFRYFFGSSAHAWGRAPTLEPHRAQEP